MIRRVAALAVFAMLALAGTAQAVTLVNPDGTPVGGQWQRWVDEMRVPTIRGALVFSTEPVCPLGCSAAPDLTPPYAQPAETWVPAEVGAKITLYVELGHQFDWRYLTPWMRHWLAHLLGRPHAQWPYGGSDNGLEAAFSIDYMRCAAGSKHRVCRYIDRIAKRVGADMEATRLVAESGPLASRHG